VTPPASTRVDAKAALRVSPKHLWFVFRCREAREREHADDIMKNNPAVYVR
jgi:hypothetical protein